MPNSQPHDGLFRCMMTDIRVVTEFFKTYLPPNISKHIDFSTLKLCNDIIVDKHNDRSATDCIYSVKYAGETIYIYLMCEHITYPEPYILLKVIKHSINK